MRNWCCVVLMLASMVTVAQKRWDGGGNSSAWNDALNWNPDGIPGPLDDVILDHQWLLQDYQVQLPSGNTPVEILSLNIYPSKGTITVLLPSSNTALPGLKLGSTGDGLIINDQGIFVNASAASSGNPVQLNGKLRINDGGRYVHRTARGNAELINRISDAAGTDKGIFEFDVPGTAGYTVSLTGNNFGSLLFSAKTAGGSKSYSGSGSSNLTIRGDLVVEAGASLTSTLTSDILLGANLTVEGKLNLHPVTAGNVGRSLLLNGKTAIMKGTGNLSLNASFRNLVLPANASLVMERSLMLPYATNGFICEGMLSCGLQSISGLGSFSLADGAKLFTRADSGVAGSSGSGSIQTANRIFSSKAHFGYDGQMLQCTGSALPDTVGSLTVNNASHLALSKPTFARDSLGLQSGNILTDSIRMLRLLTAPLSVGPSIGSEQSFVEGPLTVRITDTLDHVLPMGNAQKFAPLKVKQSTAGTRMLTVQFREANHHYTPLPSLSAIDPNGYWSTLADSTSSWLFGWRYRYADSSLYPGLSPTPAYLTDINGNLGWQGLSGQLSPGTDTWGWLESDTALQELKALSTGYRMNGTLALRLMQFRSSREDDRIGLFWKADQEGDPAKYTIERSSDGRHFHRLDVVEVAAMGSSGQQWYDHQPLEPWNYYRLHMESQGSSSYSAILKQSFNRQKAGFYPNPATDIIHIYFPGRSSRSYIEIVNSNGVVLRRQFVKTTNCIVGVSDLPSGTYYIRFLGNKEPSVLHFTKY